MKTQLITTEVVAVSVVILAVTFLIFFTENTNPSSYSSFAVGEAQQPWQPDIKASDIYQYYTMVLSFSISITALHGTKIILLIV
jgi:hypothetical protein